MADLAAAINEVLADPARAAAMGRAGRQRAVEHFSWAAIAERTIEVYRSVRDDLTAATAACAHNDVDDRTLSDRGDHADRGVAGSTPPRRWSASWCRSAPSPTARATTRWAERGVAAARRRAAPVHPDGAGRRTDRWHATIRPDAVGAVDVHRGGVRRPVPDLAPRGDQEDRGRAGQPRSSPTTSPSAPPCWSGRSCPDDRAAEVKAAADALRDAIADPGRAGLPGAGPARADVGPPGPRAGHRRTGPAGSGSTGRRALFSAWYEFFPRSEGAVVDRTGAPGAARHVRHRGPAPARGRRDGLRRGLPAADPPDRPGQPQGAQQRAGGPAGRRRLAVGDRLGRGRPRRHPPASSAPRPTSAPSSPRPATHGLEVALDLALQCAPDHPWVTAHPEWFTTLPDGTIAYAENPPKKYQDIYPLNFDNDPEGIRAAVLRVVLHWVEQGVKIFRVDNPHTKPADFWHWLIWTVKDVDPDVLFLAEAFTRPAIMHGLGALGFTQSYTYFTWRTTARRDARVLRGAGRRGRPHAAQLLAQHAGHPARVAAARRAGDVPDPGGPGQPALPVLGHVRRVRAVRARGPARRRGVPGQREVPAAAPRLGGGREGRASRWRRSWPGSTRSAGDNPALHWLRNLRFHEIDNDAMLCWSKQDPDSDNTVLVVCLMDPRTRPVGQHHTGHAGARLRLARTVHRPRRADRGRVQLGPAQRGAPRPGRDGRPHLHRPPVAPGFTPGQSRDHRARPHHRVGPRPAQRARGAPGPGAVPGAGWERTTIRTLRRGAGRVLAVVGDEPVPDEPRPRRGRLRGRPSRRRSPTTGSTWTASASTTRTGTCRRSASSTCT